MTEECVTGGAETLEYLLVLLGGCKAYVFPLLLECKYLLGLLIPTLEGGELVIFNALEQLTDDGLLVKVLFLLVLLF